MIKGSVITTGPFIFLFLEKYMGRENNKPLYGKEAYLNDSITTTSSYADCNWGDHCRRNKCRRRHIHNYIFRCNRMHVSDRMDHKKYAYQEEKKVKLRGATTVPFSFRVKRIAPYER